MAENYTKAEIIDESKEVRDGLENLVASMGNEMDKRSHTHFVNNKRLSRDGNQAELNALYRTDWVAGKVVDILPDDMTREWRSFTGDIDPEIVKQLVEEEDRLALTEKFNLAHKWARLYGTAYIIMKVDDGLTPDKPLDINKIKEGGLKFLNVIDRTRMNHSEVQPIMDPLNKNYGLPEFYMINETAVKIHHSRVLRFDAVKLPIQEFRENNYNSDSVLDRMYESLVNFNTVANGSASMVHETNVDIVQIKGLMNYMSSPEGEALVRKRFALASSMKSFNNMFLLDTDETFVTKTNTFASLPDLLDRYGLFLAGGSDIPATRLLGSAASGLNATGEGDLKNYYDTLRSKQKSEYKPKLDYFDEIMAKSLGLSEDLDLSYEFNSLFQMTEKEIADLQEAKSRRDQVYLTNGVLTETIIAKELKQDKTYTNIDDEYIEELEEFEDLDDDNFNTDPDDIDNEEQSNVPKGKEEDS